MPTLDQERAAIAHGHVSARRKLPAADWDKYKTMIHKLPSLLQTAGLCQTLHFARSRSDKVQKAVVDDLAAQLHRVNAKISTADELLAVARSADLDEYLRLTDEAMACAAWYRRLVQGAE